MRARSNISGVIDSARQKSLLVAGDEQGCMFKMQIQFVHLNQRLKVSILRKQKKNHYRKEIKKKQTMLFMFLRIKKNELPALENRNMF
jgi:hypothetical protein